MTSVWYPLRQFTIPISTRSVQLAAISIRIHRRLHTRASPAKMAGWRKPIDLMRGHPTTELLATSEMLAAANSVLTAGDLPQDSFEEDRHPLHYGPDLGNFSMRREIGVWSAGKYGLGEPISPDRINLTSGASNGLAKALELFTNAISGYTRRAFIVTPVYFLACPIFQDFGFSNLMTSVSTTDHGTSLDFTTLLAALEADKDADPPFMSLADGLAPIQAVHLKSLYRYVLYCVPTYSNPTGTTLSLAARRQLVEIARKYDILLISDDVYDFLGYDGAQPPPRLVTIDREMGVRDDEKGHTLSNCSFSKLIGPGTRCGWVESASPVLATQMGCSGANHSGGTPCHFTSTLIHSLFQPQPGSNRRIIDGVIERIAAVYKARSCVMKDAIAESFPPGTEVQGGDGGYFMWAVLPEGYDVREIAMDAHLKGVKVGAGDGFEVPAKGDAGRDNFKNWGSRHLRLSVSYLPEEEIRKGIQIFGEAAQAWKQSKG
ncbi:hypothetical protein TWF696_004038 [Orbilia brochopaga]|uniref:Aminotransferase class I/classII large domain-containing protein n=1 Tax=Orbilia brochopaga TaxID=3140254 RepID=A0AAV9V4Z0_9PEZI